MNDVITMIREYEAAIDADKSFTVLLIAAGAVGFMMGLVV